MSRFANFWLACRFIPPHLVWHLAEHVGEVGHQISLDSPPVGLAQLLHQGVQQVQQGHQLASRCLGKLSRILTWHKSTIFYISYFIFLYAICY